MRFINKASIYGIFPRARVRTFGSYFIKNVRRHRIHGHALTYFSGEECDRLIYYKYGIRVSIVDIEDHLNILKTNAIF